jgi:hypothetical protein
MAKVVDVYLANLTVWNGLGSSGLQVAPVPNRPENRVDGDGKPIDNVVPVVSLGQSWSSVTSNLVGKLNDGQEIDRLMMMGHGRAGEILIGKTLAFSNDADIAEFQRLRKFTRIWRTNVYLVGCECAADGPCVPGPPSVMVNGQLRSLCMGVFSGNTGRPGYLLLRKLADAMNAPVHASPWSLELGPWRIPPAVARLTVGPGGGWVFSPGNGVTTRFGSP